MHRIQQDVEPCAVREMIGRALTAKLDGHMVHRLDCVLMIAEGRSVQEVADWFGVGKRSVQRWVHRAAHSGIEGLAEHHRGGRPPSLTLVQRRAIDLELQAPPSASGYRDNRWTGKRLALHLICRYKVSISVRHCQRLIVFSRAGGFDRDSRRSPRAS